MRIVRAIALVALTACAKHQQADPAPAPEAAPPPRRVAPASSGTSTAPAHNAEDVREIARLRAQLSEKTDENADLQRRLSDAMNEAVRAMSRLRTLATRAEAASTMAEAEVAIRQVRESGTRRDLTEADRLLQSATAEFQAENYGGAVYLATQAKRVAGAASR